MPGVRWSRLRDVSGSRLGLETDKCSLRRVVASLAASNCSKTWLRVRLGARAVERVVKG
jgi:hypothetical protein